MYEYAILYKETFFRTKNLYILHQNIIYARRKCLLDISHNLYSTKILMSENS